MARGPYKGQRPATEVCSPYMKVSRGLQISPRRCTRGALQGDLGGSKNRWERKRVCSRYYSRGHINRGSTLALPPIFPTKCSTFLKVSRGLQARGGPKTGGRGRVYAREKSANIGAADLECRIRNRLDCYSLLLQICRRSAMKDRRSSIQTDTTQL